MCQWHIWLLSIFLPPKLLVTENREIINREFQNITNGQEFWKLHQGGIVVSGFEFTKVGNFRSMNFTYITMILICFRSQKKLTDGKLTLSHVYLLMLFFKKFRKSANYLGSRVCIVITSKVCKDFPRQSANTSPRKSARTFRMKPPLELMRPEL